MAPPLKPVDDDGSDTSTEAMSGTVRQELAGVLLLEEVEVKVLSEKFTRGSSV